MMSEDRNHVVEIFLPLAFNDGEPVPAALFELLKQELTEVFGGITAYSRAPVEGTWKSERDDLIIFEVMTQKLDKSWWRDFRKRTEAMFRQERLLIRSTESITL